MLKEERHRIILNKVNEKKIIKICDLVDEPGLTVELYRGKSAWPVIYRYANAEFLR